MRGHAASSGCQTSRDLRFEPPLLLFMLLPPRRLLGLDDQLALHCIIQIVFGPVLGFK